PVGGGRAGSGPAAGPRGGCVAGRRGGRAMSAAHAALDVLAVLLLLAGAFLCLTAGLGLVRFPDVMTRMHAGTKPQVLGVLLIMIGAAIRLEGWSATW